jgi:hypothetical protein
MAEYRIGSLAPLEPFTPEEGKAHLDSMYRSVPWNTIVRETSKIPLTETPISGDNTGTRTAA